MTCQICNAPLTVSTAYSLPSHRPAPAQRYGAPRKSPEVGTVYCCRNEVCKAALMKRQGVKPK